MSEPVGVTIDDASAFRSVPFNLEAEEAMLGAILVNNESASRVAAFLQAEHFYEPVHGRIYAAAMKLIERGQVATPVTLSSYFDNDEALEDVGGAKYLGHLSIAAVTTANAEDYGRMVYDLAMRRQVIELCDHTGARCEEPHPDQAISHIVADHQQQLDTLLSEPSSGTFAPINLAPAIEHAEAAFASRGDILGLPSGLADLDKTIGGLCRSSLTIIAGRPSMGKTALATFVAEHVATSGAKVGFLSLEMSKLEIGLRLLSIRTNIPYATLRNGQLADCESFQPLIEARREIEELPLFIDDSAGLNISEVRARARQLDRRHGLDLLIVDHLGCLGPTSATARSPRVYQVEEITQGLKALAKQLSIPILALCQLNRQVEGRDDKRPQLSDLHDSGSIEQDADQVVFIYRAHYYLERNEPSDPAKHAEWIVKLGECNHKVDLLIRKNRNGPTPNLTVFGDVTTCRFGDWQP